jgi:hypothetical protein
MSKSKKNTAQYTYLEKWYTPQGESDRVVIRDSNGRFVNNISLTALRKAPVAPNSRKG